MANEKAKKEQKQKRPSALKRNLQSEKKRLANRSFRSSVNTAIRSLETAVAKKEEATQIALQLQEVYSIVDKGVKRGILKIQKAARTKSKLSTLCK